MEGIDVDKGSATGKQQLVMLDTHISLGAITVI